MRLIDEYFPATNSKDLDLSLKLGQKQKRNIVGRWRFCNINILLKRENILKETLVTERFEKQHNKAVVAIVRA